MRSSRLRMRSQHWLILETRTILRPVISVARGAGASLTIPRAWAARSVAATLAPPPPKKTDQDPDLFDYPGVGCPGDGLLPVPLTRCIQMHTPNACWVCRLQH